MKYGTCIECEHYLAEDARCKKFDCMALPDALCKSFQRVNLTGKIIGLAGVRLFAESVIGELAFYMFKRLPEEEQVEIIAEILRDLSEARNPKKESKK